MLEKLSHQMSDYRGGISVSTNLPFLSSLTPAPPAPFPPPPPHRAPFHLFRYLFRAVCYVSDIFLDFVFCCHVGTLRQSPPALTHPAPPHEEGFFPPIYRSLFPFSPIFFLSIRSVTPPSLFKYAFFGLLLITLPQ